MNRHFYRPPLLDAQAVDPRPNRRRGFDRVDAIVLLIVVALWIVWSVGGWS